MNECAPAIIFTNATRWSLLEAEVSKFGHYYSQQIVWSRGVSCAYHPSSFLPAHELALFARINLKHPIPPLHNRIASVLDFKIDGRDIDHPTVKPVALFSAIMQAITPNGALFYDPFLGSGTTIIAAEELGRRCYGLEIEPRYCDVIVTRWEKFTGRKAVLEGSSKAPVKKSGPRRAPKKGAACVTR